ncbi:MAG TPA: ornithine cyclodeaminase family protein [Solirubrobacteraceae bacterium]|nr:ornithine cyclodeaminase family protein [Solirubrobacteraceae bacterium]
MRLRVLARADVEAALDPDALVEALAAAFAALSAGRASMPPRAGVEVPERGTILLMGAHRHDSPSVTVKLVSVFPGHDPAHQAAIMIFDAATGTPAALMDGDAITAARTAAGSRLATRLLARADADVLAVVGTGVQGEAHLRALLREREWAEVRVWGRRPDPTRELAARHEATPCATVQEALQDAGVVCVATAATEPVLRREWLAPGAHVNSVGFTAAGRELDEATVRDALVVVESRESALAPPPAGSTDLAGAEAHAELGELVAGTRPGRSGPDELTLYKSVGVGLEDDAAAALVLREAEERGLGTVVEL